MRELPNSIDERISGALHGAARVWRQALDKRLKHLGIGQSGWMTIAMVAKAAEPLSQRALADLVGVEGPSMVSMLDRLERGGLVTRAPSAHDRRVKLVQLTDAGRKIYAEVHTVAQGFRADLFDGLDPARLAIAAEVLETLRKRIEESL
ncbi:MarR family winged helix-turn-helix transcriptional regulator [Massilia sp. 9096]|uniref:MarR family winged helix-turn-helix transcriptional regulator n=1 Tax=Massilia sp. 9096 TaxID=1500894 RepID=UPI00055BE886|nr:MarR family transcriptional regulator [Massilia sp. 9096]